MKYIRQKLESYLIKVTESQEISTQISQLYMSITTEHNGQHPRKELFLSLKNMWPFPVDARRKLSKIKFEK